MECRASRAAVEDIGEASVFFSVPETEFAVEPIFY